MIAIQANAEVNIATGASLRSREDVGKIQTAGSEGQIS
jgi:hypothetical protein